MKSVKIIVYNKNTKLIVKIFDYYNKEVQNLLINNDYNWLNTSHPKSKELLKELKY